MLGFDEQPLSMDVSPTAAVAIDPTILPSPTRASARVMKRHTKGLSLNFPILLPNATPNSQSPTGFGVPSPIDSTRSSPRTRTAPFRSPDPPTAPHDKNKARGSGEFLTLLAAQERKVLELKEELQRAEKDLVGLKKQWAAFEANKKRDELRQVKKLQPMASDDVGGSEATVSEEDEERKRKRALVERNYATHAPAMNSEGSGLSRKGSKRVFEGGRHTRTLSLLSPTPTKPGRRSTEDGTMTPSDATEGETDDDRGAALSRMPTLDSLISGEVLPLEFTKTYRNLSTHRRSLPPATTDMLVKQGKQVYDGMKDGLWTFFEDIRQATVGEEGINGTAVQQRPVKQAQRKGSRKASDKAVKAVPKESLDSAGPESKDASFWKEFGLDTPQRIAPTRTEPNGHVQQKSSTDSSKPPSLLPDQDDPDEVEDGWDAWDSPKSSKNSKGATGEPTPRLLREGESLPWPEIQRSSPKMTRSITGLIKEWDSGLGDGADGSESRESQVNILDSPHI